MILHFNVTGEKRKAMVKAIEKETGIKPVYLKVPSCAYQVGNYKVGKNGELEFNDEVNIEESANIIDACVLATGEHPEEWESNAAEEVKEPQMEDLGLTVAIPLEQVKVENLTAIITSKATLIKKALGVKELPITVDPEKVSFSWFTEGLDEDSLQTYTKFIAALCKMSITQTRVQAKEKEVENEKYAFRCFLLRLGFVGTDFKADRKLLLKNLEGSAAFKNGKKGGNE